MNPRRPDHKYSSFRGVISPWLTRAKEDAKTNKFQRLEWHGDAVLQVLISDFLFYVAETSQDRWNEGHLTLLRSQMVNNDALAFRWWLEKSREDWTCPIESCKVGTDPKYSRSTHAFLCFEDHEPTKGDKQMADRYEAHVAAVYLEHDKNIAQTWNVFKDDFVVDIEIMQQFLDQRVLEGCNGGPQTCHNELQQPMRNDTAANVSAETSETGAVEAPEPDSTSNAEASDPDSTANVEAPEPDSALNVEAPGPDLASNLEAPGPDSASNVAAADQDSAPNAPEPDSASVAPDLDSDPSAESPDSDSDQTADRQEQLRAHCPDIPLESGSYERVSDVATDACNVQRGRSEEWTGEARGSDYVQSSFRARSCSQHSSPERTCRNARAMNERENERQSHVRNARTNMSEHSSLERQSQSHVSSEGEHSEISSVFENISSTPSQYGMTSDDFEDGDGGYPNYFQVPDFSEQGIRLTTTAVREHMAMAAFSNPRTSFTQSGSSPPRVDTDISEPSATGIETSEYVERVLVHCFDKQFPLCDGRLSLFHRPKKKLLATIAKQLGQRITWVTLLAGHEGAQDITATVKEHGMKSIWVPLETSNLFCDAFIDGLDETYRALRAGQAVVVHCSAGMHRTGAFGYALLRRSGFGEEFAREIMMDLRKQTEQALKYCHDVDAFMLARRGDRGA